MNGVMTVASVLKDAGGAAVNNAAIKVANGTSLNDYAPDPNNFSESQADLDRLRQGARDIESANSLPANSVGGSWFNSAL